jgi:hypothetical protein
MRAHEDIHVPAILIPDEEPPVTSEQAAVWISQPALRHDVE